MNLAGVLKRREIIVTGALAVWLVIVCLPLPQAAFGGEVNPPPGGGCCCTCENSTMCYPACFGVTDAQGCETACQGGCGHAIPCPNPTAGLGCDADTVSCVPAGTPASTPTSTATSTPTKTPVPNGGACMTPSDCASGNCVDGTCVGAPAAAPAASNGGLVAMVIALLIAAFVALRWRQT